MSASASAAGSNATYSNEEILAALEFSEIAGGVMYDHDVQRSDADVVVSTLAEFLDALDSSADVIWIEGGARIDLSGHTITVRNQTVASSRGIGDSEGALLYTTDHGEESDAWDGGNGRGVIQAGDNANITGVRFRGPYHDYYDDPRYPGYIPLDSGSSSERRRKRQQRYSRGVNIQGRNVEIANSELWGFANMAINVGSRGRARSPDLHHLYIHDCMMVGSGYAIDIMRGVPDITHSYFNATRHSIDGFGYHDCGYRLDSCVFGPITYSHAVDMHCLTENGSGGSKDVSDTEFDLRAGGRIEIRNCTFCFRQDIRGRDQEAIAIRGVPYDEVIIENNRFVHPDEPPENSGNDSPGYAWRQVNVLSNSWDVPTDSDGWTENFTVGENQFGSPPAPYQSGFGAAIDLLGDDYRVDFNRVAQWRLEQARQRAIVHGLRGLTQQLERTTDVLRSFPSS